jgi:hypothetical protein
MGGHGRQIALKPRRAKEIGAGRDRPPRIRTYPRFFETAWFIPKRFDAERQSAS